MIALSEILGPEVLRRINRDLLDRRVNYVVLDPAIDNPVEIARDIRRVNPARIQRILDSVAPFHEDEAEGGWSHFMAAAVSQQLWPDANHRTTFAAFNIALKAALDVELVLPEPQMEPMLAGSKAIFQPRFGHRGGGPFPLVELARTDHPLRRHFRLYEPHLRWDPGGQAGQDYVARRRLPPP